MRKLIIDTENRLTNQQVGELIGLTYSAISRLRSGGRMPSIATMYATEAAFGWSIADQLEARVGIKGKTAWADEFDRYVREYTSAS